MTFQQALDYLRGGYKTVGISPAVIAEVYAAVQEAIAEADFDWKSMQEENKSLRREVNALRAKLNMGRKYVEFNENKPTGRCPVNGG